VTHVVTSIAPRRASQPTLIRGDEQIRLCGATAALAAAFHFALELTVVPAWRELAAIFILGIGPVGAAFFLWDYGMKRGDPRLLGTLVYATLAASTLLLCTGGHAKLTWDAIGASMLVSAGGVVAACGGAAASSS
jgi:drug/metabolite transporter (DMT)-like permease